MSAVTAGGLCLAGAATAQASSSGQSQAGVTISTASSFVQVGGDTMVRYGGPAAGSTAATVSGTVTGLPAGVTAVTVTLLGEPFGATAFVPAGQQVTAPAANGTADYSFSVSPTAATGYEAQVSHDGGTAPTTSAARTVYVIPQVTATTTACTTRPYCSGILTVTAKYPPAAFASEAAKGEASAGWYTYGGIRRSSTTTPAAPAMLGPGGNPTHVTADPATDTVHFSVGFRFNLGTGGYQWKLNYCSKDIEASDGIGLPGHHGCGDPAVSASAPYLG